jgi:flagellar biosynthesis protein FlhG
LNLKVEYLGFIYDDQHVSNAVLRQKPFMVVEPKCKASLCVQHIVERMDRNKPKVSRGFGKMMRRLFGSKEEAESGKY